MVSVRGTLRGDHIFATLVFVADRLMATGPKPNLSKSTALAKSQALFTRVNTLTPNFSTPISPVTVYQPLPAANAALASTSAVVGNALLAAPAGTANVTTTALWGVWIAPDLNNGLSYTVQVESFAAGGGGGGGNTTSGGGGGGGGEYACEPSYTVVPGYPYIWVRGIGGYGGYANASNQLVEGGGGFNGGDTIFDLASTGGVPGGVHAHGGVPGDVTAAGVAGAGGSGSANSIVSEGGSGATNNSTSAGDNPLLFQPESSLWTAQPTAIGCWLPMDDEYPYVYLNNAVNPANNGMADITDFTGLGIVPSLSPTAPSQVPTSNNSGFYEPSQYQGCIQYQIGNVNKASARAVCQPFNFSGTALVISGWIQCDPSGIWTTPGSNATIATNCAYTENGPGVALYMHNTGSSSSPSWALTFYCANSSTIRTISATAAQTAPVPGTWYYVVATFNSGTMTLYVDGVSVASASTSTPPSVSGGASSMTLGMRTAADANLGWYFGYMSNFWFAQGVPNTTLLNTAYGLTSTPSGGGGGASGGASTGSSPFTNGGSGSGTTGGTPATPAAIVSSISTEGFPGGTGATGGATKGGSVTTAAAGGGGSGNTTGSLLAVTTITANITTAATYNGIDASTPGALYNPNQQGTQGTLLAGGQASDPGSGSKNSLLILPPGLQATLTGKTIVDCYLTFYNANPSNTVTPVLEINYSNDTYLPTNYELSAAYTSLTPVAPAVLPDSTSAQVVSLMNTPFTAALQNGTATAIVLGPGGTSATPPNAALDAYNAPAANYFYTSIYGPGSLNSFGASTAPTLTIMYTNSAPFQGETGGSGEIAVTYMADVATPVATIQPYSATDSAGNSLGQGFTGFISAFEPNQASGQATPETWHAVGAASGPGSSFGSQWGNPSSGSFAAGYRLTAEGELKLCGSVVSGSGATGTSTTIIQLPSGYYPTSGSSLRANVSVITGGVLASSPNTPYLALTTTGMIVIHNLTISSAATTLSLDGVVFPITSATIN
jgi:Concanavalin A-like lectin/glucanases superfamily